jgi:tyrosyl-tRNA synthetase
MSASVGNNIPLLAPPDEMFGRTMRIPDELLADWWALVAQREAPAVEAMESKLALARFVVARSHGEAAAAAAQEHFDRVVRHRESPEDLPDVLLPEGDPVHLPVLLVESFGVGSRSEARRLISQGGVNLDGEPVTVLDLPRERLRGGLLQVGKRRFARLTDL